MQWTPAVHLALTIGPSPGAVGPSEPVLREAWASARAYLLADGELAGLWGFWAFEPDVPAELRATWPTLVPLAEGGELREREAELAARRRAWLGPS